jgi:uncharacterized Ntn-hydrolase superfamily protein
MKNLAHTYSIVARDPETRQLGVAVQSHWFAVGALCPWAEAGVGAIATQSLVDPGYGALGLHLLRAGKSAVEALAELLAKDENRENRQVAIVDTKGQTASHTGKNCIAEAGYVLGNGWSVQANMMKNSSVWPAMAKSFEATRGDLAERMLAALFAAQEAGGDIRGKQSAAMLVVDGQRTEKPWEHVLFNIRVDDHPEPLKELQRLIKVQRAYHLMNEGDEFLGKKDFDNAMLKYQAAEEYAPHLDEIPFWVAVTLADSGELEKALLIFKKVFGTNPDWAELVKRLPAAGFLKKDDEMMKKIMNLMNSR